MILTSITPCQNQTRLPFLKSFCKEIVAPVIIYYFLFERQGEAPDLKPSIIIFRACVTQRTQEHCNCTFSFVVPLCRYHNRHAQILPFDWFRTDWWIKYSSVHHPYQLGMKDSTLCTSASYRVKILITIGISYGITSVHAS